MQDLGEEGLIQYLISQFALSGNLVGIGDDCAVIPSEKETAWLVTTDSLVEGVHFLYDQIPPSEAGYKLVAANVSDISSKGGEPQYAFLTIAAPKNLDCEWLKSMLQGIKAACGKWRIQLLGGDTVSSKRDIFLSLTLIGTAIRSKIKYRHMARPGDTICVTGYLGDAGAGLKCLQSNVCRQAQTLVHAHFHPQPNPKEGIWLASFDEVHAMMDISDGLNCDLRRLLSASQCGGIIEIANLPLSEMLLRVCKEYGWDPVELGLTGGEDYCLLLTMAPDSFEKIQKSFYETFEKDLFKIGQVLDCPGLRYQKQGQAVQLQLSDFEHF